MGIDPDVGEEVVEEAVGAEEEDSEGGEEGLAVEVALVVDQVQLEEASTATDLASGRSGR
jgi:hypothetical protein